jgi:hypothetical protein
MATKFLKGPIHWLSDRSLKTSPWNVVREHLRASCPVQELDLKIQWKGEKVIEGDERSTVRL